MWKEFREFALRGNVVDMAIGILIGAAFTPVVQSLVNDVVMPPIGLLFDADFTDLFTVLRAGDEGGPYTTLADAEAAGAVVLAWGRFLTLALSFLVVAWVVFLLVRAMNRLRRRAEGVADEAPVTRTCPFCASAIPSAAVRCPLCTSELPAAATTG